MMGITRSRALLLALLVALVLFITTKRGTPTPNSDSDPKKEHGHAFRQRLVAVGDLHGDIDNARTVLRMAGLLTPSHTWSGGSDILVQTGDIVDRGHYALDIYELMQRLRSEAAAAGGRVVSVLGNHEFMNALGDWRYVSEGDIKRFGGVAARQAALSRAGWLGAEWLANYSTTARVHLSPFPNAPSLSFTHGSLRPTFASLVPYPDNINALGRSLLARALTPPLPPPYPPNPYPGFPPGTTPTEQDLYASGGPLWWRGLASAEDEGMVCRWAGELQEKLGVRRVIGGHTPNFERIVHRCNASIIIIDTGISSAYGGVLSALEIIYTLTPKDKDHRADPLRPGEVQSVRKGETYIEREEVYAIYPHAKTQIALEVREVVM